MKTIVKNVLSSVIVCMFAFSGNAYAQKSDYMLSKKDMYKEFDYLIHLIKEVNPHLPIYKEMMGYDVIKEMKKNRADIKKIDNWAVYYLFMETVLSKIPEAHTQLMIMRKPDEYYATLYPFLADSATAYTREMLLKDFDEFASNFGAEQRSNSMGYMLHLSYIDGKYYVINSVDVTYKGDSVVHRVSMGDELLKINGTNIPDFMKRNIFNCGLGGGWDVDKKMFHNWYPTRLNEITSVDVFNINMRRSDLFLTLSDSCGKEYVINYAMKDKELSPYKTFSNGFNDTKWLWLKEYDEPVKNKVLYFDSILYVKMKSMSDLDFFKDEIVKYGGLPIEKVVVDVRSNGGGSDDVWHGVLQAIVDTTLCRKGMIGIADSDMYKRNKFFLSPYIGDYPFDSLVVYKDPILKRKYRLLSGGDQCMNIIPDSSSIKYKGQIYLLHDRDSFSSSTAFLTFALGEDRVIAVGEHNGNMGGYGVTPFVFQLPYSKFAFIMHSSIHIPSDAKSVDDYFWNKTEVKVNTNPEWESIMYVRDDVFVPEILKTKDPYFKKVLEM